MQSPLSYAALPPAYLAPASPSSFSAMSGQTGTTPSKAYRAPAAWSPSEAGSGGGGGGGGGRGAHSPSSLGPSMSGTSVGELVDKALNRTAAVQVVLRVRPLNSAEMRHSDPEPCLRAVHDHRHLCRHLEAVVNRGAKEEVVTRFTFDRVVPPEVGQRELFETSGVRELMDAALTGINVSVFAYGQTGSGKTYTMSGLEENLLHDFNRDDQSMGIISRAVSYLFQRIDQDAEGSTTVMKAAFSEIYNEVRCRRRAGGAGWVRPALFPLLFFQPPSFLFCTAPRSACTTCSTSRASCCTWATTPKPSPSSCRGRCWWTARRWRT